MASVGDVVSAPIKRAEQRFYEDARVTWVSKDGRVVEVAPLKKGGKRQSFPQGVIRERGYTSEQRIVL